jgi:hypothetical protein
MTLIRRCCACAEPLPGASPTDLSSAGAGLWARRGDHLIGPACSSYCLAQALDAFTAATAVRPARRRAGAL